MGVCVRDRGDALSSVPAQADVDSAQSEGKNMPEEVVGGLVRQEGPLWGHLILSTAPPVAGRSHSEATLSTPVWALGRLPGVGYVAVGCQVRGGHWSNLRTLSWETQGKMPSRNSASISWCPVRQT